MTDKKLKELLAVIDNRYGRVRSKEECIIEIKTCVQAFGMVPDEIVEKALYAAFAECRFPKQIIVDWHVEIKKLQATVEPSANDLWAQAAAAARKIEANLYYQTHGGFIAPDGRKLKGEDFKKENAKIFAALPMVVQRWAGSPADLSEIFSSRSSADLRQFVRPGFDRAVQDAPVESLQPRHRLEVARRENEKTIPQPDRVRFVCDGWLYPHKHGLLPAGERSGNRAGHLRQQVIQLGAHGRRT